MLLIKSDLAFLNEAVNFFLWQKQLFKRLTQQVRDVNQCMNQQRIYSFKVHWRSSISHLHFSGENKVIP